MTNTNNNFLLFGLLAFATLMTACSQNYQQTSQHQSSAQSSVQTQRHIPTPSQRHPASQSVKHPGQQAISSSYQARNKMIRLANRTLGTRYRYGGSNPQRGFDCSGLMLYVHKQAGITIPRTAAKQRLRSRTISYAQLKPGDMLFFKTGKRTEHVGIYIGNRQFIHASTGSRRVRVAKMDSAYWYKHFIKFGTFL